MNNSVRNGYVGGCVTTIAGSPDVVLDADHFVATLLLSERYVLHSVRLQEIPQLIQVFGYEPVLELLDSKWLRIKCDANLLGVKGSAAELKANGKLLNYEFIGIRATDHPKYVTDSFIEIHPSLSLTKTEQDRLECAVQDRIDFEAGGELGVDSPESKANRAALDEIAGCTSVVRRAVESALADDMKIVVESDSIILKIQRIDNDNFRAYSNLEEKFGLPPYRAHQVIQEGLLRVTGMYGNLGLMDRYSAMVGFNANDFQLSDLKLQLLSQSLPSDRAQLARVLSMSGFPSVNQLGGGEKLKLERLLEIREWKECRQFRNWLSELANRSDEEIKDELGSYRSWLGDCLNLKATRILRFVVGQAAGLVPGVGIAWSFVDDFFLDRFRRSEPVAFVNRLLPSVFS